MNNILLVLLWFITTNQWEWSFATDFRSKGPLYLKVNMNLKSVAFGVERGKLAEQNTYLVGKSRTDCGISSITVLLHNAQPYLKS